MTAVVDRYAGVVFDLDGVVHRAGEPLPGAAESVTALRERGVSLVFASNNSSATPEAVAALLSDLGVPATAADVVTSAQAAADLLDPGTRCLVIGEEGLRTALADRGCVETGDWRAAEAVVVGWDRSVTWDDLRRATLALHHGARFIGTNGDRSYPSPEGPWPGNGAVLAALTAASQHAPEIAGKPHAPLLERAAARLPAGRLLMVGDRHETDVAGAAALGWDTALVLTGVTGPDELAGLDPPPTYVLGELADLLAPPG